MECTTGCAVCASHRPSLKATWDTPPRPAKGRQGRLLDPATLARTAPSRLPRGSWELPHSPAPLLPLGQAPGSDGRQRPSPSPTGEPRHAPPSARPSTLRPGAAEARGSPPAGSRADRLTWMGHRSRQAARQLRLHRLSRPRRARACLPAGQGPEPATPGYRLRGPRWDPHRPPACTQP